MKTPTKLFLKQDKKAKSTSFFFKKKGHAFNTGHIKFLENYYKKEKKDVRICLHTSIQEKHHDMIILQQKKNFYPPHKHLRKGETYHIIKGSMACVLFNKKGKIINFCKLKKNDIFRTPTNVFHTMLPITKTVIYHESKVGSLLKKNDSIFSKWSKLLTNNQMDINTLKRKIFSLINK